MVERATGPSAERRNGAARGHAVTGMKPSSALVVPVTALLAAGLVAAPVAAATPSKPKVHSTAVTLKSAHATTKPKHKVSITATLKSGHTRVAGETLYLEQRDATTHKFSNPVAIGTTDGSGQVSVPVTPGNHKGKKEQYRVVFQGDSGYKHSRSGVITISVS